jgi:type I restriction enzyme S subunit
MIFTLVPLRHVANVRVSNVDKKSVEDEPVVKLCNYTDVYYLDKITGDLELSTATASLGQIQAFTLKAEDVLITKDSETPEDIGVPAFVPLNLDGVLCGYHLALLRPFDIDGRFLYFVMSSEWGRTHLSGAANGVTRFGLRLDEIKSLPVPHPPLVIQRQIVDHLDKETQRIDALIAKKQGMIELISERFDTVVREALSDVKCVWLPLKRRWRVIDCKHRTPDYLDEGIPVVSPGDATPGRLDLSRAHRFVSQEDFEDLTEPPRGPVRGDIIYSRNASIGIASYVDTDQEFCMGQDVCLITSADQSQLYLTYVLNTLGVDQLDEAKIGSTFNRVNISQIVELRIPAPEPEVQLQLASKFESLSQNRDTLTAKIRAQVACLVERRQALITAAVTGQLTISEAAA